MLHFFLLHIKKPGLIPGRCMPLKKPPGNLFHIRLAAHREAGILSKRLCIPLVIYHLVFVLLIHYHFLVRTGIVRRSLLQ